MANEIATLNSNYVDICVWIFEILAQVFSKPETTHLARCPQLNVKMKGFIMNVQL